MRLRQGLLVAALAAGAGASSAQAAGNTVSIGLPNAYGSFIVACPEVGYPSFPLDLTLSMQSFAMLSNSATYLTVPDDGVMTSWSSVSTISMKDGAPTASVQLAITAGVAPQPVILYTSPPGTHDDLFYSRDIPLDNVPVTPGQSIALVMKSNLTLDPHSLASVGCVNIPARAPASWAAWSTGGQQVIDTQTPTQGQMLAFGAKVLLDAPVVSSIDVAGGPAAGGNSLTILGNHMANPVNVTVGSLAGTVTSATNTAITITVPPQYASDGKGPVPVTVYTAGGKSVLPAAYTYAGGATATPTPTPTPTPGDPDDDDDDDTPTPQASSTPTPAPANTPAPVNPGPSLPQAPQSQVVAPIPQPAPIILPGGTITAVKTSVSAKHVISLGATVSPAGSLHAKATATIIGATGRAKKAFAFGSATATATKAGKVALELAPSTTAKADLKHHHLAVTIELTFTPKTGTSATHETTLTVK